MFFPRSPNLPTVGDVVCLRYTHTPYTVALISPDNTLYHLVGLDEPARIETLAWYPQVGDVVEILFHANLRYLESKLAEYNRRYWTTPPQDRAPIERTIEVIKKAMKKATTYRTGKLLRVDRGLVQVEFPGGAEVLPFICVSTVSRDTKAQPAEAHQPRTRIHPYPQASANTQQPTSAASQPSREFAQALVR